MISLHIVKEICEKTHHKSPLPERLLQFLLGEISYGGQLIHQEDKEIMQLTVRNFINNKLIGGSGLG